MLYTHLYGHRRVRSLPWNDLSAVVAPLRFPHGALRQIVGPKTFKVYLREHHSPRGSRPPLVDFRHRVAVFWAVGPRSSEGYALEILSVTEQKRRVVILGRERTPTLRRRVRIGITYPFRLLTIPRTRKPIFLDVEGRP